MRTEHELRDAFAALAEQAPSDDVVLDHLRTAAPALPRRRRAALVLAAVVAVVLALVLPSMLTERTAVPANTRSDWNLTHRVDPPSEYVVSQQQILARRELTVLAPTSPADRDRLGECTVDVHGPGSERMPERSAADELVDVQGREGFYREPPDVGGPAGGVFWRQSEDVWARANCHRDRKRSVDLAQRVAFSPVPVRLPFQLRSLPKGYQVLSVLPDRGAGPAVDVGVGLAPVDSTDVEHVLGITIAPAGTARPSPGPGEPGMLAGRPAVFDVGEQSLCALTQDQRVCVAAGTGDPAEEPATSWPAGRREQLTDLGGRLRLSADLTERATWTGVDEALPR